jgi:predicted RNase H-like nuclease (RuvC/YqgF family)
MTQSVDPRLWWELHLRKARGETLSEAEQQLYDAETARQDRQAPPLASDLQALKELRDQVRALARDNTALRARLSDLDAEIRRVEAALSRETRQALGVGP